jgi:hypothetical protein
VESLEGFFDLVRPVLQADKIEVLVFFFPMKKTPSDSVSPAISGSSLRNALRN